MPIDVDASNNIPIINHSNMICESINSQIRQINENDNSEELELELYAGQMFETLLQDQELPRNISEYGSINKVLHNCLTKLIPDTQYLLSLGHSSETLITWMVDYKYYMNITLQSVYTNVLRQQKILDNHLLLLEKTKHFNIEKIQDLPIGIQEKIYEYIPHNTRAQVYLTLEESQKRMLMQMRVPEIKYFVDQVYRYFIVLGRIRATDNDIRTMFYRIGFSLYSGMRKLDMLNIMYAFIRRCIFIKTKKDNTREYFHKLAFRICQVIILKMKNMKYRETRISQQIYIKRQIFILENKLQRRLHYLLR